MNAKQKECFTPHVMMHSLVGLGLGFVISSLIPGLPFLWIGVSCVVIGIVADAMRK